MTTERVFLDTNVLVYAFGSDGRLKARARDAMTRGHFLSPQVMNEFVNVLRSKQGWSDVYIGDCLEALRASFDVVAMTAGAQAAAFALSTRQPLHIYDAMIVATAADSGCTRLLTEDMGHGTSFLGVAIENPFRDL